MKTGTARVDAGCLGLAQVAYRDGAVARSLAPVNRRRIAPPDRREKRLHPAEFDFDYGAIAIVQILAPTGQYEISLPLPAQ